MVRGQRNQADPMAGEDDFVSHSSIQSPAGVDGTGESGAARVNIGWPVGCRGPPGTGGPADSFRATSQ